MFFSVGDPRGRPQKKHIAVPVAVMKANILIVQEKSV